jgi:hypothetical protein
MLIYRRLYRLINHKLLCTLVYFDSCNLLFAFSMYSLFVSNPSHFLFYISLATAVVPDPIHVSNTISPSTVLDPIRYLNKSNGF